MIVKLFQELSSSWPVKMYIAEKNNHKHHLKYKISPLSLDFLRE